MNPNEIGIGILDIYDDDSLLKCTESLMAADPQGVVSTYVITNRKNPLKNFVYDKKIGHSVSMATLRNHCLSVFRCAGLKYIFLINSNVVIKDPEFIQKTISTASAFGTWLLTGYVSGSTILDDDSGQSLTINTKVDPSMMFLRSGVIGNLGYLDERYVNSSYLDVLDYVERSRKLGIYPPTNFFSTIGDYYDITEAQNQKIDYSDTLDSSNHSVGFSYGYFKHVHGYVPTIDDIKSVSKEQLMDFMSELQTAYAQKS